MRTRHHGRNRHRTLWIESIKGGSTVEVHEGWIPGLGTRLAPLAYQMTLALGHLKSSSVTARWITAPTGLQRKRIPARDVRPQNSTRFSALNSCHDLQDGGYRQHRRPARRPRLSFVATNVKFSISADTRRTQRVGARRVQRPANSPDGRRLERGSNLPDQWPIRTGI